MFKRWGRDEPLTGSELLVEPAGFTKVSSLQVPTSTLFRSGTGWAVFVEEKGKARRRVVEVGQRNGVTAEIISGLKENEKIVAYPEDSINDGTKIQARK